MRVLPYVKRRLTRIYPTYWEALALTLLLSLSGGHVRPSAADAVMSVLLFPSSHEPLLGVAWTLQFEIVFYFIFAIKILQKRIGQLVLGLWSLSIILNLVHYLPDTGLPESIFSEYNLEFLIGMFLAFWLRHWKLPSSNAMLFIGGLSFTIFALLENLSLVNGYSSWMRLAYGMASFLLIGGCASAKYTSNPIPVWLRIAGSASFSIYLFQFVFIGIAWKLCVKIGLDTSAYAHVVFFLLSFTGVLGGILISRLVEYPLMHWVRLRLKNFFL